jgi:hypothetical protein
MIIKLSNKIRIRTETNCFIVEVNKPNENGENWVLKGYHSQLKPAAMSALEGALQYSDKSAETQVKRLIEVIDVASQRISRACEMACHATLMSKDEATYQTAPDNELFEDYDDE